MKKNKNIILNGLIDLAQPRLGTKVVYRTDDFFAAAKRIIDPSPPIFKEGVFDKNGKWMDGWETRRKRIPGHDFIIIKLEKPGVIDDILIDTSFFNGNQPEFASIEGCYTIKKPSKTTVWTTLLNKKKLRGRTSSACGSTPAWSSSRSSPDTRRASCTSTSLRTGAASSRRPRTRRCASGTSSAGRRAPRRSPRPCSARAEGTSAQ